MNGLETNLILGTLQSAFPSFYKGLSKKNAVNIADLWRKMFEDDDFNAVMAAVQALIATRIESYPPTIGEVKAKLQSLREPEELSEQDAWAMVSKACQNGYYHSAEEFEKLPEVVRQSVGSPEQLKAWSQMDADTVESVVASNFMRTFKVKKKRQKEMAVLPTEIKNFIGAVSEKMRIEESKEKKQIEQPKEIKVLIPELVFMEEPVKRKMNVEAYKPLDDDDFEKRRQAMLKKMSEHYDGTVIE